MFESSIRSLLLLQFAFIFEPLGQAVKESGRRPILLCVGSFICLVGIIFCDANLLPEVFGATLVLLNFYLAEFGHLRVRRPLGKRKYVLFASLVVFALSFILRSGVAKKLPDAQFDSSQSVLFDKDGYAEVDKRLRIVVNHKFGDGAYERARIEKTETDSAYCFAISIPGGTNCVIQVMKGDGKVYMDANAKGDGK